MGLTLEQTERTVGLSPYPRPELLDEAGKIAACDELLRFLLREQGLIAAFSATYERKRKLVRSYMNQRMAHPVPPDVLAAQDALFWTESVERNIVGAEELSVNALGIGL